MLHEGTEGEPETVEEGEVVGVGRSVVRLLNLPLVRTEPADEEQYDTDGDVREDDTHPDLIAERVHEREHPGLLFLGLLDHDADAELHERLRKVDDAFALRGDRQRCDRDVCLLNRISNKLTLFIPNFSSYFVDPTMLKVINPNQTIIDSTANTQEPERNGHGAFMETYQIRFALAVSVVA